MTETQLYKPALHEQHMAMGADMGGDDGWDMPLSYRGALAEVEQVRRRAGVCDVSHFGRIAVRGDEALDLLERVCTADIVHQEDDTALLSLLCNERGGVIDQVTVLRMADSWLLTTSPGRRQAVLDHLGAEGGAMSVKIIDRTAKTTMLHLAGPAAEGILERVLPVPIAGIEPNQVRTGSLLLARYVVVRTDALGVWSLDIVLPNLFAAKAWRFITDKAGDDAIVPMGLAGRDVMRIEAGLCRFGYELNETIDPFTAGLGDAVDFEHDFLGRDALADLKDKTPARRRVGLVMNGQAENAPPTIPRLGSPVRDADGREIGTVTSGTYSPMLDSVIAMAYVSDHSGGQLDVQAGDGHRGADVVELPFAHA